jgi:hypothetical protein
MCVCVHGVDVSNSMIVSYQLAGSVEEVMDSNSTSNPNRNLNYRLSCIDIDVEEDTTSKDLE